MFNKVQSDVLGVLETKHSTETLYMLKEDEGKYFVSIIDHQRNDEESYYEMMQDEVDFFLMNPQVVKSELGKQK
jgi:hypothetical protein